MGNCLKVKHTWKDKTYGFKTNSVENRFSADYNTRLCSPKSSNSKTFRFLSLFLFKKWEHLHCIYEYSELYYYFSTLYLHLHRGNKQKSGERIRDKWRNKERLKVTNNYPFRKVVAMRGSCYNLDNFDCLDGLKINASTR